MIRIIAKYTMFTVPLLMVVMNPIPSYGNLEKARSQVGANDLDGASCTYEKYHDQNEPDTQARIFKLHCERIIKRIHRDALSRFIGEQVSALLDGNIDPGQVSVVALSGMIAVAHLLGFGGLRDLLLKGKNNRDGFGTCASDYMKKFHGYF